MKKALKITGIIILTLVVMVTASEIILRQKGYALDTHDTVNTIAPELRELFYTCGWAPQPRSIPSYEDENVRETTWDNGQRASREPEEKIADKRMLVLGCSYTYAMGVNDDETYVWLLNDAFPKTAFDNYGVLGYGTYQCLMMEKLILSKHKYDGVLYACMGQHFCRNDNPSIRNDKERLPFVISPWVEFKNNQLYYHPSSSHAWPLEDKLVTPNFLKHVFLGRWLENRMKNSSYREGGWKYNENIFKALVAEMAKTAKEHQAEFYVASIDPDGHKFISALSDFSYNYVDVSSPLVDQPTGRVKQDMKRHPNATVHKMWADKLTEYLKGKGWQ